MFTLAIAGLGTVGAATLSLLEEQAARIASLAGQPVRVAAVSARDKNKKRPCSLHAITWVDDPVDLLSINGLDAVVELMGGAEGKSRQLVETALSRGISVITANKALLATHGTELSALATINRARVGFEAAVGGGIPVIKALREGLAANPMTTIRGILNGTCNYILSQMHEEGWDFTTALTEAQRLGFAEADPSADIDGHDTGHKLALLSALAFGLSPNTTTLYSTGIRHITPDDLSFANDLNCRIKLLGVAQKTAHSVVQRVGPCLVPTTSSLAHVHGSLNAVLLRGDYVGDLTLEGRGAGPHPTASAVVADIIDMARGATPHTLFPTSSHTTVTSHDRSLSFRYYVRLYVHDEPGVVAAIACILRDARISIESLLQRGRSRTASVPIVITTHPTQTGAMKQALDAISKLPTVSSPPCVMTLED